MFDLDTARSMKERVPVQRSADRVIRVRAPQANAGVGDALRRAFAPPPVNGVDAEFASLLERI